MFYDRLGGGRGLRTFRYTLRLTRDSFDAYVDNRRQGWWQNPLTRLEQAVFDKWRLRDDQEIWKEVQSYLNG